MAMRCFGLAFLTGFDLAAGAPLAFDLMVLRAEDLAAVLWPDHFFFTAGCAAARDATFFLAMGASLFVCDGRLTQNFFAGWAKAHLRRDHHQERDRNWHGGHASLLPTGHPSRSMQPEHAVDRAQLGRLDQPGMRDRYRKQRAIQLFLPEGEEILQRR